jgi:surface antigen
MRPIPSQRDGFVMRTFQFDAAVMAAIAAAALAAAVILSPREAAARDAMNGATLAELRAGLSEIDRANALGAVQLALSEIGDGQVYVWRNSQRQFTGVVHPTATFMDSQARLCRHLVVVLTLGQYRKSIEGIACRGARGLWSLTG